MPSSKLENQLTAWRVSASGSIAAAPVPLAANEGVEHKTACGSGIGRVGMCGAVRNFCKAGQRLESVEGGVTRSLFFSN